MKRALAALLVASCSERVPTHLDDGGSLSGPTPGLLGDAGQSGPEVVRHAPTAWRWATSVDVGRPGEGDAALVTVPRRGRAWVVGTAIWYQPVRQNEPAVIDYRLGDGGLTGSIILSPVHGWCDVAGHPWEGVATQVSVEAFSTDGSVWGSTETGIGLAGDQTVAWGAPSAVSRVFEDGGVLGWLRGTPVFGTFTTPVDVGPPGVQLRWWYDGGFWGQHDTGVLRCEQFMCTPFAGLESSRLFDVDDDGLWVQDGASVRHGPPNALTEQLTLPSGWKAVAATPWAGVWRTGARAERTKSQMQADAGITPSGAWLELEVLRANDEAFFAVVTDWVGRRARIIARPVKPALGVAVLPAPEISNPALSHACGHATGGPFDALEASLNPATAPALRRSHVSFEVRLPPGASTRPSFVSFEPQTGGRISLFFESRRPVFLEEEGQAVVPQFMDHTERCPSGIDHFVEYDLTRGTPVLLRIEPTIEPFVRVIFERGWVTD